MLANTRLNAGSRFLSFRGSAIGTGWCPAWRWAGDLTFSGCSFRSGDDSASVLAALQPCGAFQTPNSGVRDGLEKIV